MRDSNETNVAYVSRLNNISNNKNHLSPKQQKESFHVKSDGKGEKKDLRKLPHFAKRRVCWSCLKMPTMDAKVHFIGKHKIETAIPGLLQSQSDVPHQRGHLHSDDNNENNEVE